MPLSPCLLLIVPAQVASPVGAQPLDQVQALVGAIPEAFVQGRAREVRGLVARAKAGWERARPELRGTLPEAELLFIDRQLKAMQAMKPREQAVGALGIAGTLDRHQGRTRVLELRQAERAALLAWCNVDAGMWEALPRVKEAFQPVLDQDRGAHPRAVAGTQEALKRLQAAQGKRRAPEAKQALRELVDLAKAFGKA